MFGFDLALLGIALGLLVLVVAFTTGPFGARIGLDLSLQSPKIASGDIVPIEADVTSVDGATHQDIRLTWHLPPWVEIVRAEPPLSSDGTATLGRVTPIQDARSRLYVTVRAVPSTPIPFDFTLWEGSGMSARSYVGSETRRVATSSVTAEPAIAADAVQAGGTIPIVVRNAGSLAADAVIVRLTSADGAPLSTLGEGNEAVLGSLAPGERRVLFLNVDPAATSTADFVWEVQDRSQPLSRTTVTYSIADPVNVTIAEPLRSTPGAGSTDVQYESAGPAQLWVTHPLQTTEDGSRIRTYDLGQGSGQVHIPLDSDAHTTLTSWSVVPFEIRDGKTVIGKRIVGSLSTAFPFSAAARYYAVGGDQLGIGPLPPKVGEATSYWVVWSVGPTDADLKDLTLRTTLASGVTATGKSSSQTPGTFASDGSSVTWTIPSLPATGASPATFAFEIFMTPTASQKGTVPVLVKASSANATEVRSGLVLESHADAQDANLSADVQGRGLGKVE